MRQVRFGVMIGCLSIATMVSGVAWAQSRPFGPGPGFWPMMQHEPGMANFMGGATVTGQPFCAQVTFQHNQKLPDQNMIQQTRIATVCRDDQGSTSIDQTLAASSVNPQHLLRISDAVARRSCTLDTVKKVAHCFNLPPARTGVSGASQPNARRASNPNVSTVSLGSQSNWENTGLYVTGTQITRTIQAGQIGNQQAIQITTICWHSPDLSINVTCSTTDPLHGDSSTSFSNISRDNPTIAIPSDYTIATGGPRRSSPGARSRFAPPATQQ